MNAGLEGSVVVENIRRKQGEAGGDTNLGYDAFADEYVNLIDRGVIDPAKVTRAALENASSIAALVLTTDSLVTDVPDKKGGAGAPGMPPGGMEGMDF